MSIEYDKSRERVETVSETLEEVIEKIVKEHIGELDSIIHQIKEMLNDETAELTDREIEDILLQLPILLYDVTDNQEIVGLQSDLSSQIYKEAYNEAYKIARGTVADKTSVAELTALAHKLDTLIYDRSYKIIKQKLTMAMETLNSIKKVQATRQLRAEMGRFRPKF